LHPHVANFAPARATGAETTILVERLLDVALNSPREGIDDIDI
jgi:hypothetical protein